MPRASKGVLVQCDPSIKAIIVQINSEHHDIIIEELDDETVLVKQEKLEELKRKLGETLKDTVAQGKIDDDEL